MPNNNHRKLFVGGLDPNVDDSELYQYFARYGDIENCKVYVNRSNGKSRLFGFVTYYDANVIEKVIADKPHGLRTKQVELRRAVHKHQSEKFGVGDCVNKLYVRNIGNLKAENLYQYFSQFGNILQIEVKRDYETGLPRGFAFITFDDYDSVDKIVIGDRHVVEGHVILTRKAKTENQMRRLMKEKNSNEVQPNSDSNMDSIDPKLIQPPMTYETCTQQYDNAFQYPYSYQQNGCIYYAYSKL